MSGLFQLSNSSYLSFIDSDQTLNFSYFVHMVREGDNSKNRQIKPPSFGIHRNTSSIALLQKVQKDYYLVIANEHFECYCSKSYSCTDFNLIYESCWHIVTGDLNIGRCKRDKRTILVMLTVKSAVMSSLTL